MSDKDNSSIQNEIETQECIDKSLQVAYTEINHIFNISFPICFIDKDHNMVHVNDTFCSFFKIPREEILGKKCYEIKGHAFCGTQRCTLAQLSNGMESCDIETEFEIDNEKKTCIISARPYRNSDGEILGIVENFVDITARRKAEEDLRELEAKYHSLVENAWEGIWAIDQNAITTYANQRMADILGYSVEEMLGQHLFSFMDEQGIELAKFYLKRREEGIKEEHPFEFLRKDGTRIYTRLETSPILEKDGTYFGAIACITDITAQHHAEEELRKSEEKFRSLFNSTNDAITITDLEGRFLEVNSVSVERYGYSREEFLTMNVRDIILSNAFPQRVIEITNRGCAIFETVHKRRDGTIIPVELSTSLIDYAGEKAILSISRDISERKRYEDIQKYFISTASHELLTPLAALSQSISNLQKYDTKLTEKQKIRLNQSILRNMNLLMELANDLLMISQLDERKLKLEWIPYSLYTVLQEILLQLEPKRITKEIEIEVDIDKNIRLFGDSFKIGQIFRIILDNSLKYSANNTKIQIIAINNYEGPYNPKGVDGVLIQFSDSGRGIRPEDLSHIFERFFRSEDVRVIPGTGLGLSIALSLIQLHQGEIHVESIYGQGTTSFLFLPRLENKPTLET